MEGFDAVEVWLGQGSRFHAVHDYRNEHIIIYPQLPLQREAGMSPEVMQRVEVFPGLAQPLRDILSGGALSGEVYSKVLRARHLLHQAPCVL